MIDAQDVTGTQRDSAPRPDTMTIPTHNPALAYGSAVRDAREGVGMKVSHGTRTVPVAA